MVGLGVLMRGAGRVAEAEAWHRKAAEQDHTLAMVNLGGLLEEAGRVEEAEGWRRRAREMEGAG